MLEVILLSSYIGCVIFLVIFWYNDFINLWKNRNNSDDSAMLCAMIFVLVIPPVTIWQVMYYGFGGKK